MDRLLHMLHAQYEFQVALGNHYPAMTTDERIEHIKEMILACEDELHEALGEIGWKSWATSKHINEEAAFGELRDAWQFLTNAMFAVTQADPDILAQRLHAALDVKLKENHRRNDEGYDGVSSKCPQCRRDLSEVQLKEVVSNGSFGNVAPHVVLYCPCGREIERRPV
jgi:hypothetical protein